MSELVRDKQCLLESRALLLVENQQTAGRELRPPPIEHYRSGDDILDVVSVAESLVHGELVRHPRVEPSLDRFIVKFGRALAGDFNRIHVRRRLA